MHELERMNKSAFVRWGLFFYIVCRVCCGVCLPDIQWKHELIERRRKIVEHTQNYKKNGTTVTTRR